MLGIIMQLWFSYIAWGDQDIRDLRDILDWILKTRPKLQNKITYDNQEKSWNDLKKTTPYPIDTKQRLKDFQKRLKDFYNHGKQESDQ